MNTMKFAPLAALLALGSWQLPSQSFSAPARKADVIVYGGTSAAVTAAVQVRRMGKSVIVVSPDRHLGGLSSGGLGFTDTGNKAVIGGLAREFYHRIWKHYQQPQSWRQQTRESYGNKGQGTAAIDGEQRTMWIFEPHAAEQVFEDWVREHQIELHRDQRLDRQRGVSLSARRIIAITTRSGQRYEGAMFIDATYEGDLMAAAGVAYHVGRESNATYGEQHNGVQTGILHHRHHFGVLKQPISPYRVPGDPNSGVLAEISTADPGRVGEADKRLQAYCFRACFTNAPTNRIPFPKPEGYDPARYELLLRVLQAGWDEFFEKFDPIPNLKTDTNNHGPFSFDYIGGNYDYPEASDERRLEIIAEHRRYQQGLLWFVANDPRVPPTLRREVGQWGLPKDEFKDNGHWPHQLYIREARRMIGSFVMTENELRKRKPTPDSIGMGSYTIDSHNVQRYITPEGSVQNEGDIGVSTGGPYAIAYGSILPKRSEATNLCVPVAVSASHIAYGSIRMEPVFMILGQSAATAAALCIDKAIALQDLDYPQLRALLLKDGQVLAYEGRSQDKGRAASSLKGIVVDDLQASAEGGEWSRSQASTDFIGEGYAHDGKESGSEKRLVFRAQLPKAGRYRVLLHFPAHANRASNARVILHHAKGQSQVTVNQRQKTGPEGLSLGEWTLSTQAEVQLSNVGANGFVVADALRFLPLD